MIVKIKATSNNVAFILYNIILLNSINKINHNITN